MVYTADSIRKFDSKSNRTADSIRDSIRTQKNDSQVPSDLFYLNLQFYSRIVVNANRTHKVINGLMPCFPLVVTRGELHVFRGDLLAMQTRPQSTLEN